MPSLGVIVPERGVKRYSGLPGEMSSLVGLGTQIGANLDGLRTVRVVALTGPGLGSRMRLALRAAALAACCFEDSARLVGLASLADPAFVRASVMSVRAGSGLCWQAGRVDGGAK